MTPVSSVPFHIAVSKHSSSLSMYMPKMVGDREKPLLISDISFNVFRTPFVGIKIGSDSHVEADHNNPQFRRNHDLFKSPPKLISRNNVEIFSKVHKTKNRLNLLLRHFTLQWFWSDKMVDNQVMSLKTIFPFCSFALTSKPKAKRLFQNEPIKLG